MDFIGLTLVFEGKSPEANMSPQSTSPGPLLFISYKHADRKIMDIINSFVTVHSRRWPAPPPSRVKEVKSSLKGRCQHTSWGDDN